MKFEIKELSSEAIYPIRHEVLRKGKPFETSFFDGDNLETTKHFGLFIENNLIGALSLFKNENKNFVLKNQFQLRGMAILESHQSKGFGKLLIRKAEEFAKNLNTDLIWFNAREHAVFFYKKSGYEVFGKPFDIENIGLHYVMFKKFD